MTQEMIDRETTDLLDAALADLAQSRELLEAYRVIMARGPDAAIISTPAPRFGLHLRQAMGSLQALHDHLAAIYGWPAPAH